MNHEGENKQTKNLLKLFYGGKTGISVLGFFFFFKEGNVSQVHTLYL